MVMARQYSVKQGASKMIPRLLVRTNYLKHYSLRLLIGDLLRTLSAFCVAIRTCLRETLDFIWLPPLCGTIGWALVLPLTYTIPRPSKERVAVDALSIGLIATLYFCCVIASFKDTCTKDIVKPKARQTLTQKIAKVDPRRNNSKGELWEHQR